MKIYVKPSILSAWNQYEIYVIYNSIFIHKHIRDSIILSAAWPLGIKIWHVSHYISQFDVLVQESGNSTCISNGVMSFLHKPIKLFSETFTFTYKL